MEIERAEGTDLIDAEGRRYIDGVSSLWCNVHGHRHPLIDRAVREQLERVAHSTMLGLTHRSAAELAARLVELAPPGLSRVFYSDSGSTRDRGRAQDGLPVLAAARRPARPPHLVRLASRRLPRRHARGRRRWAASTSSTPPTPRSSSRPTASSPATPTQLERVLDFHAEEIAAVIVEPLVQGAAGMRLQPPGYLRRVRELCDRHDVLPDLRRGGHRVRAHRDDVRLRAGAGGARLPLPRQGADRRLPAARGNADHRARPRRLPRRSRGRAHLLPRPHFHRQPARLRGGARQPRRVRDARTRCFACSRRSGCSASCSRRSPRCPRSPRCGAGASWSGSTSASTTRPCASATRWRSRPASAGRSSARSATWWC